LKEGEKNSFVSSFLVQLCDELLCPARSINNNTRTIPTTVLGGERWINEGNTKTTKQFFGEPDR
jgi:hypothetical protein